MVSYTVMGIDGIKDIQPGDDLGEIGALALGCIGLQDGDIVLLAHKIVSKAEGALRRLSEVKVSAEAERYARITGKDARQVQVILEETEEVLCAQEGILLCLDKRGLACANAGVDASNSGPDMLVTLPKDADASAARLRQCWEEAFGVKLGVIICDTHGRPFRNGASGVAIGAAGVVNQKSYIGKSDRYGRVMQSSVEAAADELACAATLLMGQGDEGVPMVVIRGYHGLGAGCAKENVRGKAQDISMRLMGEKNKQRAFGETEGEV